MFKKALISSLSLLLVTACASQEPQILSSSIIQHEINEASALGRKAARVARFKPQDSFEVIEETAQAAPQHDKAKAEKIEVASRSSGQVSDDELDENRGAFSPEVLNSSVLEATSTSNVTVGGITGANLVSSDAFGNAQGVVSLIQNTGNNVIIQNSTIVNLTFQ